MTQQVPMQAQPKKAAGFWTPWGNVRVPDLDSALEKKAAIAAKLPHKAVAVDPKSVTPVRRG